MSQLDLSSVADETAPLLHAQDSPKTSRTRNGRDLPNTSRIAEKVLFFGIGGMLFIACLVIYVNPSEASTVFNIFGASLCIVGWYCLSILFRQRQF
jgi:hypothetical protein